MLVSIKYGHLITCQLGIWESRDSEDIHLLKERKLSPSRPGPLTLPLVTFLRLCCGVVLGIGRYSYSISGLYPVDTSSASQVVISRNVS